MIREVLRMGDPRLWQPSAPVERFDTPELHALLQDMRDTMAHLNGAGLAAPQIGVALRVVIFGVKANPRYPGVDEVPDTVLINPVLSALSAEEEEGWEGCLSVPGLRGWVPRWRRIRYAGCDERGGSFERGEAGGGATRAAAGMLAPAAEIGFEELDLYALGRESLRRWPAFLVLEAGLWWLWADARGSYRSRTDAYRDLAWEAARIQDGPRVDAGWPYYEAMSHYLASGAFDADPAAGLQPEEDPATYNGSVWSLARGIYLGGTSDPGSPEYAAALAWSWR